MKPFRFALCAALLLWSLASHAGEAPAQRLSDLLALRIVSGDGRITLSWQPKEPPAAGAAAIEGLRVYRLTEGLLTGYNVPPFTLVEDRREKAGSVSVGGLENGEQYVFTLKAYDGKGHEFLEQAVAAFPGTSPKGSPARPAGLYAVAGDGRLALFWEKNTEADLVGYEVFRKDPRERDFRLIARLPKFKRGTEREKINGVTQSVNPGMFLDSSVANGVSYRYRVRAVDAGGVTGEFSETVEGEAAPYRAPGGRNLLLLVNADQGGLLGVGPSEKVALHYAERRGVPRSHIVYLHLGKEGRCDTLADYQLHIQKPVQKYLRDHGLLGTVRYLVPCYGMPVRAAGRALDSKLADLFDRYSVGTRMGTANPYYESSRPFDGTDGIYLVTRLDGPSPEVADLLVEKALAAEKSVSARSGSAYLASYGKKGEWALDAAEAGRKLGVKVVLKDPDFFSAQNLPSDCYWYYAWRHPYRKIRNEPWPVGALGAHLISDSFKWMRNERKYGTSWVQGLLEDGITATFGAVIEPYLQGYTRPDLLFSRFWSGEYDFAEAFMAATPTVQWAMSAVGDPLYRLPSPSGTRRDH